MSCVIVGPPGEAGKFGLSGDLEIVRPEAFPEATRQMTRLVVIGPRLLNDKDFELVNRVPAVLVLTNAVDVLHMEMHIRAGRLHLTPYDAIVLDDPLEQNHFVAPWVEILPMKAAGLADFIAADTAPPLYPVPAGFEVLSKPALVDLAVRMRELSLVQFDLVLGASPACHSLMGILCNMANTMLAGVEALPPDAICAEPDALEDQLAAHPGCRVVICPVLIGAETPAEAVNQVITTATQVPVNLMCVIPATRLPHGRILTCLIYEIG